MFAKLQLYSVNLGTPENPDYDLQLDAKIMEEYKGVLPAILDMCVALGKNDAIGINGFKKVDGNGASMLRTTQIKSAASCTRSMKKTQTASIALMRQRTNTSF